MHDHTLYLVYMEYIGDDLKRQMIRLSSLPTLYGVLHEYSSLVPHT